MKLLLTQEHPFVPFSFVGTQVGDLGGVLLNLQLLSSGNRYLVRSDDVIETVYNDRGEIVKTKQRRIFMLNDVLMCATASSR